jgi:hypothetical protein
MQEDQANALLADWQRNCHYPGGCRHGLQHQPEYWHPRSTNIRIPGAFMKLMRRLQVPASESHVTIALVLSVIIMSMLLWGVMWQSGIIGYQQELIQQLWQGRFGGG